MQNRGLCRTRLRTARLSHPTSQIGESVGSIQHASCCQVPGAGNTDWSRVKANCRGILITPFQRGLSRREPEFHWYRFACAGGCFGDASCLVQVSDGGPIHVGKRSGAVQSRFRPSVWRELMVPRAVSVVRSEVADSPESAENGGCQLIDISPLILMYAVVSRSATPKGTGSKCFLGLCGLITKVPHRRPRNVYLCGSWQGSFRYFN